MAQAAFGCKRFLGCTGRDERAWKRVVWQPNPAAVGILDLALLKVVDP
jgi:hypothetical protein